MDEVDKIVIISNRSGANLRNKVMEEFSFKLEENERSKFQHENTFAKNFPSGEVYVQLQENVRRRKVHVIAGFYRPELYHLRRKVSELANGDIQETLIKNYLHSTETDFVELLKILDASRRSGAEEISVYFSCFPDARQDKKDEPRVPISAKLKFDEIAAAGGPKQLSRIGVIDLHAQQEQGFTDCPVDQIAARSHLLLALKNQGFSSDELTLICADPNDYKGIRKFADKVGIGLAVILKSRIAHNEPDDRAYIEGSSLEGRVCVLFDDMIDTSNTILNALKLVKVRGAKETIACATHGIFSPTVKDGKINFAEDKFKEAYERHGIRVITTDTIARTQEYLAEHQQWLTQISVAPLIADLIYCNETGSSHGTKLEEYAALARDYAPNSLEKIL